MAGFFPNNPPQFYTVPFSLHDHEMVRSLLIRAGFERVQHEVVEKTGASPSAAEAATGLIEGNPILGEIMKRRPEALPEIKTALARQIVRRLGDQPVRCALRAHVFTATAPPARNGRDHRTPSQSGPGGRCLEPFGAPEVADPAS